MIDGRCSIVESHSGNADSADDMVRLRDLTGLSSSQLGRLFGVYSRTVNGWMTGHQMHEEHHDRLVRLLNMASHLHGSTPEERRAELLDSSRGMSLFHQLAAQIPSGQVVQYDAITARDQVSMSDWNDYDE
jgi:hypothetical protein